MVNNNGSNALKISQNSKLMARDLLKKMSIGFKKGQNRHEKK